MSDNKKQQLTSMETELADKAMGLQSELKSKLLGEQAGKGESVLSKYLWVGVVLATLAGAYIGADLGGLI